MQSCRAVLGNGRSGLRIRRRAVSYMGPGRNASGERGLWLAVCMGGKAIERLVTIRA